MFGFLGFLLAVPVAGAAKTIGVEIIDWYQHSRIYTGEREPEDTIIIAPGETPAD
jgi:predicted PurR-regulated permease PerM